MMYLGQNFGLIDYSSAIKLIKLSHSYRNFVTRFQLPQRQHLNQEHLYLLYRQSKSTSKPSHFFGICFRNNLTNLKFFLQRKIIGNSKHRLYNTITNVLKQYNHYFKIHS